MLDREIQKDNLPQTKMCNLCQKELPISKFQHSIERGKTRIRNQCKDCQRPIAKKAHKQWWDKNRDKGLEYSRVYYANNREKVLARTNRWAKENLGKKNAAWHKRKSSILNSIEHHTAQDVLDKLASQNHKCYWCDEDLTKYHVDHVVPLSKGGSNGADNIVISCPRCNLSKGDKSAEEWRKPYLDSKFDAPNPLHLENRLP